MHSVKVVCSGGERGQGSHFHRYNSITYAGASLVYWWSPCSKTIGNLSIFVCKLPWHQTSGLCTQWIMVTRLSCMHRQSLPPHTPPPPPPLPLYCLPSSPSPSLSSAFPPLPIHLPLFDPPAPSPSSLPSSFCCLVLWWGKEMTGRPQFWKLC